jgi:hypothetical protein
VSEYDKSSGQVNNSGIYDHLRNHDLFENIAFFNNFLPALPMSEFMMLLF